MDLFFVNVCGNLPGNTYTGFINNILLSSVHTTPSCSPSKHEVRNRVPHGAFALHIVTLEVFLGFCSRCAEYFLFLELKCLIHNHTDSPRLYLQSSRDHPGLAFLWGHWHVVLGLRDSRALPRLAPLPGGLRVWSGNTEWFLCLLKDPTSIPMNQAWCAVMFPSPSMSVCTRMGCILNPPDSPRRFSHSLPVYLNRCHRATCPISTAPVLPSKTFSISLMMLTGKP